MIRPHLIILKFSEIREVSCGASSNENGYPSIPIEGTLKSSKSGRC
jgi:hypothetical protein